MFELGVGTTRDFTNLGALKRAALLVDSLAIVLFDPTGHIVFSKKGESPAVPLASRHARYRWRRKRAHLEAELEWLSERGFIRGLKLNLGKQGSVTFGNPAGAVELHAGSPGGDDRIAPLVLADEHPPWIRTPRIIAAGLRGSGIDAVPLFSTTGGQLPMSPGVDSVVCASLKALPEPDPLTPWEAIFDFRGDRTTIELRTRFMTLLRRISQAELPQRQAEEALLQNAFEYEAHMRRFHLQSSNTGLEALFAIPAELAEDLIKIRWSSAVRRMFALKHARGELLQAEATAPGREIAYLLRARHTFGARRDNSSR